MTRQSNPGEKTPKASIIHLTKNRLEYARMHERSTWRRGVLTIAINCILPDDTPENAARLTTAPDSTKVLLNGTANAVEYVDGGYALTAYADIANTLCTPSERKRWQALKTDAAKERWERMLWAANTRATRQAIHEVSHTLYCVIHQTEIIKKAAIPIKRN